MQTFPKTLFNVVIREGFPQCFYGKCGFVPQAVQEWMDDFCRISCGAPAESELLTKQFLMARETLSSSFFGYNLHIPPQSPQNFLSGLCGAYTTHELSWLLASREETEIPTKRTPPSLSRDPERRKARGVQKILTPLTQLCTCCPFSGRHGCSKSQQLSRNPSFFWRDSPPSGSGKIPAAGDIPGA